MASLRGRQPDLAQFLRSAEERLQALETAQRAGYTSIGDGAAMQVRNASDVPVAYIGTLPHSGGYGIEISTDDSGTTGSFVELGTDTKFQNLTVGGSYTLGSDGARYRIINGVCHFQLHVTGTPTAGTTVVTFPVSSTATHWYVGTFGGVVIPELKLSAGSTSLACTYTSGAGGICATGSFPIG